jgi:hypothetical protein
MQVGDGEVDVLVSLSCLQLFIGCWDIADLVPDKCGKNPLFMLNANPELIVVPVLLSFS